MTHKPNECCDKCKVYGMPGSIHCNNTSCPCHTQSNKVEAQSPSWEQEFDKTFDLDHYGNSHIVQKKVKQFISSLLAKTREESYEKGFDLGMQKDVNDTKETQEIARKEALTEMVDMVAGMKDYVMPRHNSVEKYAIDTKNEIVDDLLAELKKMV